MLFRSSLVPRSRLGLTTARPHGPGAAPTCSDGCLVVHGHGYSCAHGHHHRLACIFWGKNCPVTFSAPEEAPGWWGGLGSPLNSRLGRSLSERGAAREAACYHHLGSLRSASYLPLMCWVPPTSPCSSEAARSVCGGPWPPGQRCTIGSLTLRACSVSGPQSCLHAAAPLELGDPAGTHPGDSRGIPAGTLRFSSNPLFPQRNYAPASLPFPAVTPTDAKQKRYKFGGQIKLY